MIGLTVLLASLGTGATALAIDHVTFKRDDKLIAVQGRLVESAENGGLLLQSRDGTLWAVQPEELVEHTTDSIAFKPMSQAELSRHLLAELPAGFDVYSTKHYLICHNTSRAYAQWCGSLFERLYLAFTNFWSRKRFEISEPEFPLVAIVFSDKRSYVEFSRAEVGDAVEMIIGHYSLRTNRMVMYDLTGLETSVATIVHEATHQIAFSCGLHVRYSDCPMWFSEGIAVYFETPDLTSSRGWRGIGAVNWPRLRRFHEYLPRRGSDSLVTLIADDGRFQGSGDALQDAYAEVWALTYFLINRYPKQYTAYLRLLSQKGPLRYDDKETRIAQFKQCFGEGLSQLDAEFIRYMMQVR